MRVLALMNSFSLSKKYNVLASGIEFKSSEQAGESMNIRTFQVSSTEGRKYVDVLLDRFTFGDDSCQDSVTKIIGEVREKGDEAVLKYTRKFDAPNLTVEGLKVTDEEFAKAEKQVDDEFRATLSHASGRIRTFHEREMEDSWFLTRDDGAVTGRLVRPVDSAGLYVPGGQGGSTPLVSSVLMNGIPA